MKLTESELNQIIEEELNEIFGLSKKDKLMDRILSVDDSKTKKELKGLSAKALAAIWDHVRTLARSKKTGVSHTKYTGGTGVKSINTRSKNAISKIVSGAPGTSPEQHDIIIKNVIAQIKKSGIMLEQLPGYAPGRTRPGDMALFSRDRSGGGGDKRRVQLNLTALSDETAQHILAGLNQEFSAYEFVSGAGQPGQPGDQPDQPGEPGDQPDQPGEPGDQPDQPDEPAPEEEKTVAIYKGKGGVSLQSFIDRLGGDDPEIKGVVRSTILKHIANQMKKQNVQVVQEEEAGMAYRMIAEEFINSLDEAAVAIYNHPAGKQHSLNAALQKLRADGSTGIEKEKLGKLLNALARWAKSQGLKVNEEIENSVTRHLDERAGALAESKEAQRWKVLSGIK